MGILDLNGSDGLLSTEGSPIYHANSGELEGIRLPNLHNRQFATSFAFFCTIDKILSRKAQGLQVLNKNLAVSLDSCQNSEVDFVVKVRQGGISGAGFIVDVGLGLVVTNSHCIKDTATPIEIIYILPNSSTQIKFQAIVIGWNDMDTNSHLPEEALDICILKILKRQRNAYSAAGDCEYHNENFGRI